MITRALFVGDGGNNTPQAWKAPQNTILAGVILGQGSNLLISVDGTLTDSVVANRQGQYTDVLFYQTGSVPQSFAVGANINKGQKIFISSTVTFTAILLLQSAS